MEFTLAVKRNENKWTVMIKLVRVSVFSFWAFIVRLGTQYTMGVVGGYYFVSAWLHAS